MSTASAPLVRSGLLQALREKVLPRARMSIAAEVLLLQLPEIAQTGAKVMRREAPPLPRAQRGYSRVTLSHWLEEGLNSFSVPYIGFVLDGEADLEIGITQSAWKQLKESSSAGRGGASRCIVTLPRNTFFIIPPGVPHPDGKRPHWARPHQAHPHQEQVHNRIFWLHILPSGALCHTCTSAHGRHTSTRNLFVKDPYLTTLTDMCLEELRSHPASASAILQSLLLTLFLRVERELARQSPLFTDHGVQNVSLGSPEDRTSTSSMLALERACRYIRAHLDEPLSLSLIARHAYVSVSQLKRIFQAELKMPVMRFVTQCRIETARSLLEETELPVGEISLMVGYRHPEQLSRHFLEHNGLSPRAYRRDHMQSLDLSQSVKK